MSDVRVAITQALDPSSYLNPASPPTLAVAEGATLHHLVSALCELIGFVRYQASLNGSEPINEWSAYCLATAAMEASSG